MESDRKERGWDTIGILLGYYWDTIGILLANQQYDAI
jgi:hypothetical protein